MNNALIFDLLLVVFVLLFALIGFWRGVVKEGLAAGGILFGALLADNWSARFGTIGSNVLNITGDFSRFLTIEVLLLAFTLVVGYGSGSILVPPVRGLGARFGGAVIGATNATLVLAFSLQAVGDFVHRARAQQLLSDSVFARFLILHFNWLLLVIAGVVLALLFGRLVTEREMRTPSSSPYLGRAERRAARLPAPADAGKLEPSASGFNPATSRYQADAPTLRDLSPAPPSALSDISEDRIFPFRAGELSMEPKSGNGADWRTIRFSSESAPPIAASSQDRCSNCGEPIDGSDEFCPLCGRHVDREEASS
jgi:uncharacterized membrane protein required for colicin V production